MKSKKQNTLYDLAIVGAGISGTALLYVLNHYSDIKSMAIMEKHAAPAQVSSNSKNNSQTLHFGDIETNFSLEKAKKVKFAAEMTRRFLERFDSKLEMHKKLPKMVLAVGAKESSELKQRYEEFKHEYPKLKLIYRDAIAKIEPKVVEGRDPDEEIAALFTEDGYTVNYGKLAETFLQKAVSETGAAIDVMMGEKTEKIERGKLTDRPAYRITTDKRQIFARTVAVTAGGYSLIFAQALGYGKEYTFISAAGGFYFAPRMLNGKVYRAQIKDLPFAAIHGDPDINDLSMMRFGPTAKIIPFIERRNYATVKDYLLKIVGFRWSTIYAIIRAILDPVILPYGFKNFFYDWPIIGKRLFISHPKKIIPSIKLGDLTLAKGIGGSRPQIINIRKKKLELGEAKIIGDNIIFNITPSPGATRSLGNAYEDAKRIIEFLGPNYRFHDTEFKKEFID